MKTTSLVASSTCVLIGVICCFKELSIGDPCSCVVSVWRVSGKSFLTHWSVPDHSLGSFHLFLYGPQPWADDRKARLESQRPPLSLTVPFDRTGHSTAVKLSEQTHPILLASSSLDAISKPRCGLQDHVLSSASGHFCDGGVAEKNMPAEKGPGLGPSRKPASRHSAKWPSSAPSAAACPPIAFIT